MSSRGGPPRNYEPSNWGASNTNFRGQAYATALVNTDSTAEESGNGNKCTREIGLSQDAEILDLDVHVSGYSSSLMVMSKHFDFDEIESIPRANDTDNVNFLGSEELTTQVSQETGTTTNFAEEEFAFMNKSPEDDFCFYFYPDWDRHALAPVDEPTRGTISKSVAANENCRRNKNVARSRDKQAMRLIWRTAKKRRAAGVLVVENQETTGSSEPK